MATSIKWSVSDYHLMIQRGILNNRHVELIAGEIIEVSPESPLHRFTNDSIAEYLRELLKGKAKLFESHPITLDNSEPEPDLAIVRLSSDRYVDRHPYSEDIYWLIEISNTTLDYDLNDKKRIYASAGINEYWVVDIKQTELIVFSEVSGNDYQTKTTLSNGTVTPLAFPDLKINVSSG
jgi:Uma2 family endonuclease